jgi:hypothetical protein
MERVSQKGYSEPVPVGKDIFPDSDGAVLPLGLHLMRLLICGGGESAAAAAAIDSADGWEEVVALADRWKVFPALAARVASGEIQMPARAAAGLARMTSVQFFRTTVCMRAGCDALRALATAGIPAIAFKGAAVIAHLHRGMRERMVRDVDVLVHGRDLQRSLEALETAGFHRTIGEGSLEDYTTFVAHSPGAAGNHAISLSNRQDAAVDLHWKLGRFDPGELLESASTVPILGTPTRVARPAFGLLLTVHHALRNDLVPGEVARDVLDCAGWFRLLAGMPAELVLARAQGEKLGLADAVDAMAIVVRKLGGAAPEELGTSLAGRQLADLYFRQSAEGPINTDLAYLGSPRAAFQILQGALTGWRRYQGMMRAFESRQGEASLSLGERAMRLARSIARLSPSHWRQLRALTRAKDRLS